MKKKGEKILFGLLATLMLFGTIGIPAYAFNRNETRNDNEYYIEWDEFWEGYNQSEIDSVIYKAFSDDISEIDEYESINPFRVTYRRVFVSSTINNFTPWRVAGGQLQCGSRANGPTLGMNSGGGSNISIGLSVGVVGVSVSVRAGSSGGGTVTRNVTIPANIRQNAILGELRNQVRVRRYRLYTAGSNGRYTFLRNDNVASNIVAEYRVRTARAVRGNICPL